MTLFTRRICIRNISVANIGFPDQIRKFDNQFILTSFKFAKFCRAVKITIQIHSLIIRFNFFVKGNL